VIPDSFHGKLFNDTYYIHIDHMCALNFTRFLMIGWLTHNSCKVRVIFGVFTFIFSFSSHEYLRQSIIFNLPQSQLFSVCYKKKNKNSFKNKAVIYECTHVFFFFTQYCCTYSRPKSRFHPPAKHNILYIIIRVVI
jgi:hypothetical protein